MIMKQELIFTVRVQAEDMDGTPEESAEIIGGIIYDVLRAELPHDVSVEPA